MKNSSVSLILISLTTLTCRPNSQNNGQDNDPWIKMSEILNEINAPIFPEYSLNVVEFGADPQNQNDSRTSIQSAINSCNANGGGTVTIPKGSYKVNGPINLKSNVNLHIEDGATLYFSTHADDYLPSVKTRWEGVECYNYSPLIYAYKQENIGLTGKGTLDGQASNDNWWSWSGSKQYGWREGMPSQADSLSRPRLFGWNTLEVPVEQRILGKEAKLRPNFIQPYNCRNIIIDGITIKNSPMWILHPVLSENITISDVKVISHGPNSDGCDPEACKNVLIKNCYFDTGDDCIALKSGRNQDGRNINRPIENVVIQGCTMRDGHGGVVIGSEVSGGARNIFAEDCVMDSPNLDRAIRIKTNKVRGGTIDLYFRNIQVGEVKEAVVRVNMRYPIYSDPNQEFIPTVQNFLIENVTSNKSKFGILIDGYSEDFPVRNLIIKNCRFNGVTDGNDIEFAQDLVYENYYMNGKKMNPEK